MSLFLITASRTKWIYLNQDGQPPLMIASWILFILLGVTLCPVNLAFMSQSRLTSSPQLNLSLWIFLTPPTFLAQYPVRNASSTLTNVISKLAVYSGDRRSPGIWIDSDVGGIFISCFYLRSHIQHQPWTEDGQTWMEEQERADPLLTEVYVDHWDHSWHSRW